jgi:hypothetical protein
MVAVESVRWGRGDGAYYEIPPIEDVTGLSHSGVRILDDSAASLAAVLKLTFQRNAELESIAREVAEELDSHDPTEHHV